MKSVIILLALVAFCQAAPLDVKESTPETSTLGVGPIAPDVVSEPKPTEGRVVLLRDDVLNRQKRDEVIKPDNVKAHELLQHDPHRKLTSPPSPESIKAHEGLQHSHPKREAHHEPGHQDDVPKEVPHGAPEAVPPKKEKRETEEKPDSVKTKDSLAHHEHASTLQADTLKSLTEVHPAEKKAKREAHHEEDHKEQPQTEDLALPHALPSAAPAVDLTKKEKRETQEKPDNVKAKESLDHQVSGAAEATDIVKSLVGAHPASDLTKKQEKRDIATTKAEGGSTTPSAPHFKRPVPVDVLLHQKHDEKTTSSSEESKESKEKVKA